MTPRNVLLEIARMDPEARAAIEALGRECDEAQANLATMQEFAVTMETERDEARAERDALWSATHNRDRQIHAMAQELAEARAQRNAHAEALRHIYTESLLNRPETGPLGHSPKATIRALGNFAREALAAVKKEE